LPCRLGCSSQIVRDVSSHPIHLVRTRRRYEWEKIVRINQSVLQPNLKVRTLASKLAPTMQSTRIEGIDEDVACFVVDVINQYCNYT